MPAPKVTLTENDLAASVPQNRGVYIGACGPFKKGPVGIATLNANEVEFLSRYSLTGKVGKNDTRAYWSVLKALEQTHLVFVSRAVASDATLAYSRHVANGYKTFTINAADTSAVVLATNKIVFGANHGYAEDTPLVLIPYDEDSEPPVGTGIEFYKILYAKDVAGGSANDIQLSLTPGGAAIDITAVGTGSVIVSPVPALPISAGLAQSTPPTLGAFEVFAITSADPGDWGNKILYTIEIYRAPVDVSFDDDMVVGTDPDESTIQTSVTVPWALGERVRIVPATSTDVLPVGLSATKNYYVLPTGTPGMIKLSETVGDLEDGVAEGKGVYSILSFTDPDDDSVGSTFRIIPLASQLDPETFRIKVYRFSGTASNIGSLTLLETHVVSRVREKLDGFGRNLFIEEVLENSNYIRAIDNADIDESIMPAPTSLTFNTTEGIVTPIGSILAGGSDGSATVAADWIAAASVFEDAPDKPIKLLLDGGLTDSSASYQLELLRIAEARKDCFCILSAPEELEQSLDPENAVVNYVNTYFGSTRFGGVYSPWPTEYDKFNARTISIPPDGPVAARISKNAREIRYWADPSGVEQGLLNVRGVSKPYNSGTVDYMFDNRVNAIILEPGYGICIAGDKTLYSLQSPLNQVGVTLLLNIIGPESARALKRFLGKPNDEETRHTATLVLESYFDTIVAGRGIKRYKIVCNESNNLPADEDNGRMVIWAFVTPTTSVREIPLQLIITPSSITFDVAETLV